jgi:hypothetical protein
VKPSGVLPKLIDDSDVQVCFDVTTFQIVPREENSSTSLTHGALRPNPKARGCDNVAKKPVDVALILISISSG